MFSMFSTILHLIILPRSCGSGKYPGAGDLRDLGNRGFVLYLARNCRRSRPVIRSLEAPKVGRFMAQSLNPEFRSHYTSFAVLRTIVKGQTIPATDIFPMTGAAEFRYAIELIESMLDDFETGASRLCRILSIMASSIRESRLAKVGRYTAISFVQRARSGKLVPCIALLEPWRMAAIAFEKPASM